MIQRCLNLIGAEVFGSSVKIANSNGTPRFDVSMNGEPKTQIYCEYRAMLMLKLFGLEEDRRRVPYKTNIVSPWTSGNFIIST